MFDRAPKSNELRRVMNTCLPGLENRPDFDREVLLKVRGEVKVKKKLSVAFILIIVSLLIVVTALAAMSLTGYFGRFAQLEDTYGNNLKQWPVSAKEELVELMEETGLDIDPVKVAELKNESISHAQKEALVDEILQAYFSDTDKLNTFSIMLHELGTFETWPYEEKALYTSLLEQFGQQKEDWPRYLRPEPDDETEEGAIFSAIQAIIQTYMIDEDTLHTYTLVTAFMQTAEFGDEPVWLVSYHNPDTFGLYYQVVMNRDGSIRSMEAPGQNPITPDESSATRDTSTCILPADATPAVLHDYDAKPESIINTTRAYLTEIVNYSPDIADQFTIRGAFIYSEQFNNGQEPVWMMTISLDNEPVYKVLLAYNNQVIDVVPVGKEFTKVQRSGRTLGGDPNLFINDQNEYFYHWSLEEKATFSMRWVAFVNDYVQSNPYFSAEGSSIWAWTRRVFGLPADDDITQEDALSIAFEEVRQMGASDFILTQMNNQMVFFDVSDPNHPLWLFVLSRTLSDTLTDQETADMLVSMQNEPRQYFITIDARSREVLDSYSTNSTHAIMNFLGTPYQADAIHGIEPTGVQIPSPVIAESVYGTVNTQTGERIINETPATVHNYDATKEQAIASAKETLMQSTGLSQEIVDAYIVEASFFYSIWYSWGEEPVWLVTFSSEKAVEYRVLLNYEAKPIDWVYADEDFQILSFLDEEVNDDPFNNPSGIIENSENVFLTRWSHEERAAFSEKWIPIAKNYLEAHPYFTGIRSDIWRYTRRVFGIPADQNITQHEAFKIAKDVLVAYGETDETFSARNECDELFFFFDVTDPDQPQWRIAIFFDSRNGHYRMGDRRYYYFKINARTGEVIHMKASYDANYLYTFISEP